jgi:hypothetical protein
VYDRLSLLDVTDAIVSTSHEGSLILPAALLDRLLDLAGLPTRWELANGTETHRLCGACREPLRLVVSRGMGVYVGPNLTRICPADGGPRDRHFPARNVRTAGT